MTRKEGATYDMCWDYKKMDVNGRNRKARLMLRNKENSITYSCFDMH